MIIITSAEESVPARNDPGYHPLQNVNRALAYLRAKAQSLRSPGKVLCIDEDRVKSRSTGKMPSRRESQINP